MDSVLTLLGYGLVPIFKSFNPIAQKYFLRCGLISAISLSEIDRENDFLRGVATGGRQWPKKT